jgi:hypothetical protein
MIEEAEFIRSLNGIARINQLHQTLERCYEVSRIQLNKTFKESILDGLAW